MLQTFEEIRLEDRRHPFSAAKVNDGGATKNKNEKNVKDDAGSEKKLTNAEKKSILTKRCYNCGLRDHVSADCPTKDKGTKCFECNEHGHIASKCAC